MIYFSHISSFSDKARLTEIESALLLFKINLELEELTNKYLKEHNQKASKRIVESYISTLTNHANLSPKTTVIKMEIDSFIKPKLDAQNKSIEIKDFLLSTASSVFGSLIFTALIMFIYFIGQNQIKSWIRDLIITDNQIEEKIKKAHFE